MTRRELSIEAYNRFSKTHNDCTISQGNVIDLVKIVLSIIIECMLSGEIVRLDNFGTFRSVVYPSQLSYSHALKRVAPSRPYMKVYFQMGRSFKNKAKAIVEAALADLGDG